MKQSNLTFQSSKVADQIVSSDTYKVHPLFKKNIILMILFGNQQRKVRAMKLLSLELPTYAAVSFIRVKFDDKNLIILFSDDQHSVLVHGRSQ
jgi:hypothetical protein